MIGKRDRGSDDSRWRPWKVAVGAVALERLIVFTVGYAANTSVARLLHVRADSGLDIWDQWDATNYIWVAQHGYTTSHAAPFLHYEAFFPLFPLLIRGVGALGVGAVAAGLAINTVVLVVACRYLYELAEESIGRGLGPRAVLFLVLFPTAVFLVVPYSEPLFLAGAVTSFLFARKGRWLPAGVAAAVAVASRPLGIFLIAGLAAEFIQQKRFSLPDLRRVAVGLAIAVLPVLLYSWYLWRTRGSPVYFLTAERLTWKRTFVGPFASFSNTVHGILSDRTYAVRFGSFRRVWRTVLSVGEIMALILAVIVAAWSVRRREWGWAVFVGATALALGSSTRYYSVPRMLLSLFPVMFFLAAVTRSRRVVYVAALGLSVTGLCLGTVLFTHRFWFY